MTNGIRRAIWILPILAACAAPTEDEAASTAEELSFAASGDFVIYKLPTGPNPAEKIRGEVRGFVSPEIDRTILQLSVAGLAPNRTFGAHLHAAPCANDKGGGHYQHAGNAVNAENEVWLDFETNAAGRALAIARKPYAVATARARSVVVHAKATDPATGKAGDKLACVDVRFDEVAAPSGVGAPPGGAGKSCSVSYQCLNGACACADGRRCAAPADCEKVCAVCD